MKLKILIITLAILLVLPLVIAGTITEFEVIRGISDFVAGSSTSAIFSFEYPDIEENYMDAPLVVKINITSLDENYPVWKKDFELQMLAEQYWLLGLIHINTIPMECREDAPINFHPKDRPKWLYTIDEIPDGTFYCYNPNYYMMQLDSYDEIILNITSNPALYPGTYEFSIDLLEMEPDNSPPEIEFMIEGYTFAEIIPIKLNVTDMYNIKTVQYKITNPLLFETKYFDSGWITAEFNKDSGFYEDEFNTTEYGLEESGLYWIRAYACDILGNCREM